MKAPASGRAPEAPKGPAAGEPHSLGKCLFLHLAPGVANIAATLLGLATFRNPSLPPELPRMPSRFGRLKPVAHSLLFSIYHFGTPWMIPVRTLGILPLIYTTIHTRSVRPGIVAHCLVNLANFSESVSRRIGSQ